MDRIGILIELLGDKQALKSLSQLESAKKELNNGKIEMRFDLNSIRKQIRALEKERDRLYNNRKGTLFGSDNYKQISANIEKINEQIRKLKGEAKDIRIDVDYNVQGIRALNNEISQIKANAMSLRDVLNGAGTWFSAIGSGLQSIGGVFNTDVLSYITETLTQLGTNAVLSNLSAAQTRFDTMNTYIPYMEAVGISADRANASLNDVDQTIRGLPIGLDEAALDIRRTTMLLNGDVEKATKFVEGFDQALIAGGAPQQMRNYAYLEMQRLLTTGELSQKRQWMSLMNGLGVSIPYLKNAMGYGDMTAKEFEAMVYDPDRGVTGEEVIQGFANLANDEGLQELITIYKGTLESGLSNLHYALVRGLQRTFDAANETMEATIGMNFSEYLESGRNFIDRAFLGVADWIRSNPDTIKSIFKEVEGLARRAEQFDWGKLANSIIKSVESIVDIATWVYDHVPEPIIQKFITFSMVWASPLGKGFSALGNLLTTMAYLPFPQLGKLTRGMGGIGKFVGSFKSVAQGFLGISAYIGIIAEIGAVIWEFTKVAETISKADLSGLDKNLNPVINFFANAGGLATILTGVFTAISAIPGAALAVGAGELLSAGLVGIIGEIGAVIGEFADVATKISGATMPNESKIAQMMSVIQSIATGITETKVRLGTRMRNKSIKQMIGMVEDLAEALPSLQTIADSSIDANTLKTKVQSILNAFKDIDNTIVEMLDGESNVSAMLRTRNEGNYVSNLADILADLSTTIDTIGDIESKLNEYGFFNSQNGEENQTLVRIKETLESVVSLMTDVSAEVTDATGIVGAKRAEIVESIKTQIIKDLGESMDALGGLVDAMAEVRPKVYNARTNMDLETFKAETKELLGSVTEIVGSVYDAALAFKQRIEERGWQGAASIVGNLQTSMEDIGKIFDTVKEYSGKMQWVNGNTRSRTSFSETITAFNSFIEGIKELDIEGLGSMDVGNVETNTNAIFNSVEKLVNIANKLNEYGAMMATINSEGGAVYQFKKMLQDLTQALSGDNGTLTAANYTAMAASIDSLFDSLTGLTGIDLAGFASNMQEVVKQVKDLGDKAKGTEKKLEEFKTKLVSVSSVAKVRASYFDDIRKAIGDISSKASSAANNMSWLNQVLSSMNDKTITITVNTPGLSTAISGLQTLTSTAGSAVRNLGNRVISNYVSTGGKIHYLANGGTPFKPKGTDTVPAMLTPGEWVINRKASRAFGDNFMRKINNMDIPGAMDALMSRSKWIPNGNISYTTNNYNNQSVTQNFSDRKDSRTSYRRANRYLGAL